MKKNRFIVLMATVLAVAFVLWASVPADAAPRRGGILKFVVGSKIPSYDGHRESTFGMIHPIAPFYSLLIRVNPENPSSPTDFVCDLCEGKVPQPTEGGKKYTFKIRRGVKFHDGSPLTAHDIVATYKKIIWPPKGIASVRKAFYVMVEKVEAPDDYTVVFELKYPSGAFIPALASPYNFVYPKKILDKDMHYFEKNILGSGPFKFKQHQPGSFVEGVRNPDYHHKGKPYLDGFIAYSAPKLAVRVQAIRGGRAFIEFRGFPPKHVNDLKKALGNKIKVQTSDWNCALFVTPNHKRKPFDDPRVRRALTLAIDRWSGSKYLSKIAIVKTVGGLVFPGHPLEASKEELQKIAGYWPDINKSRAEAKRLLAEAGYPNGFEFTFYNRGVDQPYKVVGTWLIGQWRKVGLRATQKVLPSPQFYAMLRKQKKYDVSMDFNCQSVVSPLVDVSKVISDDRAGNNYASYQDRTLDKWFDQMNRTTDVNEQKRLMRLIEKRALDEQAHQFVTLWWNRIIAHRSIVRGWKISPSHYLNQQLDNVWLAQE